MRRIVISSASATARSTIFILRSGLTLWPPKESPARAGLSLLGDVVGGPLPTCRGVPQPTSPNLRIRVSLIRQLSAWTLCFERPPRHSRATTRPCSRAFLLRCMSQLMAHRVISLPRSNWVAFGAKRTLTSAGHATGFMGTRPSSACSCSRACLACVAAIWALGAPAVRVLVAFAP
jgi:hypothetical protein